MQQIDIDKAKVHLGDYIEFALDGEYVIVTKDDKPILKLVSAIPEKARRKAGSAKGLIKISDDFDEPLEDFKEYM